MSEHTKETWVFKDNIVYATGAEGMIAECSSEGNARRIVACWNACAGISTDTLETLDDKTLNEMFKRKESEHQAQRDELLTALKFVVKTFQPIKDDLIFSRRLAVTKASSAIAKAEQS